MDYGERGHWGSGRPEGPQQDQDLPCLPRHHGPELHLDSDTRATGLSEGCIRIEPIQVIYL